MDSSREVFRHGVARRDPLPDRVVIWTRVTRPGSDGGPAAEAADGRVADAARAPIPVRWTLARDPALVDVVATGMAQAPAHRDWTVHVDVTGLEPAATYWYAFEGLGAISPTGRTKTLPEGNLAHLRIAMVSCAKFNAGFFNGYARIADRPDLDFVLHLGDYIYEMPKSPAPRRRPAPALVAPSNL
jgi:alkaline phosphatase D